MFSHKKAKKSETFFGRENLLSFGENALPQRKAQKKLNFCASMEMHFLGVGGSGSENV